MLPWREEVSAYRTWVSEIMLQQTRVAAVLPYFERFMAAFPDVAALAAAEPDRLMKLWEGLGYYSRARNLQKAAKIVTEQYGGQFPRSMATSCASPRASRGADSTFWTRRTAARSARGWPRR